MKANFVLVGRWAFIIGMIIAILAGFADIPYLTAILFVLGLIVGFLNVTEKESTSFLVAVIAMLVIGLSGLQLGKFTGLGVAILNNFLAFVSAAGLIVALKQVLSVIKPKTIF